MMKFFKKLFQGFGEHVPGSELTPAQQRAVQAIKRLNARPMLLTSTQRARALYLARKRSEGVQLSCDEGEFLERCGLTAINRKTGHIIFLHDGRWVDPRMVPHAG